MYTRYGSNSIGKKSITYSTILMHYSPDVIDSVIVHEIAHQWWYGLVGNNQIRTPWIDEGLAEYCTAVFFETHPQYGKTLESIANQNRDSI